MYKFDYLIGEHKIAKKQFDSLECIHRKVSAIKIHKLCVIEIKTKNNRRRKENKNDTKSMQKIVNRTNVTVATIILSRKWRTVVVMIDRNNNNRNRWYRQHYLKHLFLSSLNWFFVCVCVWHKNRNHFFMFMIWRSFIEHSADSSFPFFISFEIVLFSLSALKHML